MFKKYFIWFQTRHAQVSSIQLIFGITLMQQMLQKTNKQLLYQNFKKLYHPNLAHYLQKQLVIATQIFSGSECDIVYSGQQINYNLKNNMSDFFYSSGKNHTFSQQPTYLPTAQKSQFVIQSQGFFERTPEKYQTFSSAKKGGRLSEANRSIDECSHLISQKKKMNEQAFGQVKQINNEILGSLSWINPTTTNSFEPRNRTTEQYRRAGLKQNAAISQFEWKPFISPNRIHQEQIRSNPSLHDKYSAQENIQIKSKLNTELKKNNQLLKHISNLQAEVNSLRMSKHKVNSSENFSEILEENRYLKNQLAKSQLTGNNLSLIEELQRLKAENSELRRDTLTLLKSRPY